MGRQQILPQIGFVSQKIASGEFAPRERHNSRRSAPQTIELQIFDRVAVEIIRDSANFRSIYRCNCMEPVELQRKFCSFRSIYRCKCMEPRIITTGILQSRSIYRCNSMGPVSLQREFCNFRSSYRCKCMEPRIITTGILQFRPIYVEIIRGPQKFSNDLPL